MTELDDRPTDWRIDREVEPRRERHGAEHADRIFLKSDERIANRSHDAGTQIIEAPDVIDDRKRGDVVEQRVDGEIAAKRVFFRRAERVVAMQQVGITARSGVLRIRMMIGSRHAVLSDLLARLHLAAKSRDLDDVLTELDVCEAESSADDPAVS